MKFTYVTISMHITGYQPKKSKPLKSLAINLIPTLHANNDFIIETRVNIKKSSPYSITPYSSAQPKAVMLARINTTRHRYITLSSSKEHFEFAWAIYRSRLIIAGYPGRLIDMESLKKQWSSKTTILSDMKQRAAQKMLHGFLPEAASLPYSSRYHYPYNITVSFRG